MDCTTAAPRCAAVVLPGERAERCDGVDNDCDGKIDEGFDKDADGYTTCGGDCDDHHAHIFPDSAERCDGIDNDCDGHVDEPFRIGRQCSVGVGSCRRSGTLRCAADGAGAVCDAQPGAPVLEVCDGRDNDCDGEVDEGLGTITCGVGACRVTVDACRDGSKVACVQGRSAHERCGDGIDNDCDGMVDEGFERLGKECSVGVGACRREGQLVCDDEGRTLECDAMAGTPDDEVCGNRVDDDCDGVIDNAKGLGDRCDNGQVGACRREGVLVCDRKAGRLTCDAKRISPRSEVCDHVDNDCDGEIDEGVTNACGGCAALAAAPGEPCVVEGRGPCGVGSYACSDQSPGTLVCAPSYHRSEGEECASDDNVCTRDHCRYGACVHTAIADGTPCDDDNECTFEDHCSDGSCVGGARLVCDDGNPCMADSCDPLKGCIHMPVGDGRLNACGGCVALEASEGEGCIVEGRYGPCMHAVYRCMPDGALACLQTIYPVEEICNGVDDDCDGRVDDGLGTVQCGVGTCMVMVDACRNGVEEVCVPLDPGEESCRNMGTDDDCNGIVDDVPGLGSRCAVVMGSCVVPGVLSCGDAAAPRCTLLDAQDAADSDGDGVANYCDDEGSLRSRGMPRGGIRDVSFDGRRGSARLAFVNPDGDALTIAVALVAHHGGNLDAWLDNVNGDEIRFSVKGDPMAVGLWPVLIRATAIDAQGKGIESVAVMRRDGSVESIRETVIENATSSPPVSEDTS